MRSFKISIAFALIAFALMAAQVTMAGNETKVPDAWPDLTGAKVIVPNTCAKCPWLFDIIQTSNGSLVAVRIMKVDGASVKKMGAKETSYQGVVIVGGNAFGNLHKNTYTKALGKSKVGGKPYRVVRNKDKCAALDKFLAESYAVAHTEEVP